MIRKLPLFLLFTATVLLSAAEISGHVWLDANANGKYEMGERMLPGIVVSDGYTFDTTDERGAYRLNTHTAARSIFVQRNNQYTADVAAFWHKVQPGKIRYDFPMVKARPLYGAPTILHCGDVESHQLEYAEALKKYIALHPEVTMYVLAGDISAGNSKGLKAHRDKVNAATLNRFVAYCIGNHDTDFRGRWEGGQECPYLETLGPWWYSFMHGNYLFVVAPIYNSWGTPIAYNMLDFGDWLKKICAMYPDHQKIMIAHDIPDLTGYKVATRSGDLNLDAAGFAAIIYGHKHMNIVKKYATGRKAYSAAAPNKGGMGCFGQSIRVIRMNSFGGESDIIYWTLENHLEILSPNADMNYLDGEGNLHVNVAAYNGVDEFTGITACIDNREIQLQKDGFMSWSGKFLPPVATDGTILVTGTTVSGKKITRKADFSTTANQGKLLWTATIDGDTTLAEPMLMNGVLYTAISDDANAEKGGLCALDAQSGKLLWKTVTGYGIRNNFATDGKRIFAIDSRANIHAFDAQTGKTLWVSQSDPNIVSPAASGVACENGIVIGGYGRHLRGINAEDGKVIWRNTSWATEERTPAEDRICLPGDGTALVISRLNGLYRHDISTGKVRWLYKQLFIHATAAIDSSNIWIIGVGNQLQKLSLSNGSKIAATSKINCSNASGTPVVAGNLLLVGSMDRGLAAVDKNTLTEKWRFLPGKALITTGDYATGNPPSVTATPTLDGNTLWIPCNDGVLYNLSLADGKVIRKITLGAPLLTKCIIDGDLLYIHDMTGRVFAIRK